MQHAGDPMVPQTEWILSYAPKKPFTVAETFQLNVERERFRKRLADQWNCTALRTSSGRAVDVILCPVAPTLAPPHDTTRWWGYTSYWNLADYPGAVFPVGRHRACGYGHANGVDGLASDPPRRNPVEEFISSQWDEKTYDAAPVPLQLVGRRLNEEKVLRALDLVEAALKAPRTNGASK